MKRIEVTSALLRKMPENIPFKIRIYGNSMSPQITSGMVITAIKLPTLFYKHGDIVLCKNKDMIIAHRIIEITKDMVITKGDNVLIQDSPIMMSDILGKVIFYE